MIAERKIHTEGFEILFHPLVKVYTLSCAVPYKRCAICVFAKEKYDIFFHIKHVCHCYYSRLRFDACEQISSCDDATLLFFLFSYEFPTRIFTLLGAARFKLFTTRADFCEDSKTRTNPSITTTDIV